MRGALLRYAKALWGVLVLFFLSWYLLKNWPSIVLTFRSLSFSYIAASLLCVCLAKAGLAKNVQYSLERVGVALPLGDCFRIYNLTQIAKYVPGSVWQFVGRIGYYADIGLDRKAIRDSMIIEIIWTLSGAFGVGCAFVLLFNRKLASQLLSFFSPGRLWPLPVLAALGVLAVLFLVAARFPSFLKRTFPDVRVMAVQLIIWFCFGSAFAVILASSAGFGTASFYSIGLYALAYGVGFLVIFAPAGVGVREAVLVLGLAGRISGEEAVFFAGLHRMIYLFADFLLAGISWLWPALRERSGEYPVK